MIVSARRPGTASESPMLAFCSSVRPSRESDPSTSVHRLAGGLGGNLHLFLVALDLALPAGFGRESYRSQGGCASGIGDGILPTTNGWSGGAGALVSPGAAGDQNR